MEAVCGDHGLQDRLLQAVENDSIDGKLQQRQRMKLSSTRSLHKEPRTQSHRDISPPFSKTLLGPKATEYLAALFKLSLAGYLPFGRSH